MRGKNLFVDVKGNRYLYANKASRKQCLFIAHRSEDKAMARAVAESFMDMGVDIYFDEDDCVIKQEAQSGIESAISSSIHDGLMRSICMVGLLTQHSLNSWWTPYEIGLAEGYRVVKAYIVAANVDELLPNMVIIDRLLDINDIEVWLSVQPGLGEDHRKDLITPKNRAKLLEFIPEKRLDYSGFSFSDTIFVQYNDGRDE